MKSIHFFLGNSTILGGVERATSVLLTALEKENYSCSIHSLYSTGDEDSFLDYGSAKIIHYGLKLPDQCKSKNEKLITFLLNGFKILKLRRSIPQGESSIWQGFYTAAYLPFFGRRNETIVCEHNTYFAPGRLSRIFRALVYRFFTGTIVVLSDEDKEEFFRLGILNVIKIHNASPYSIRHFRSVETKTCISVGRLCHQKRFDLMIKAIGPLLQIEKEWRLIIKGHGEELDSLKQLIDGNGYSKYITIEPPGDPVPLYESGSIFLMTSDYEGLPMTLIEAQSLGLPIIATNCSGGVREIIDSGQNGYLVPPQDMRPFAKLTHMLMKSDALRNKMSSAAVHNAKRFELDQIVIRWKKILA